MEILYRLIITAEALKTINEFLLLGKKQKVIRIGVRETSGRRYRHFVECADIPIDTDIQFVFDDILFLVDIRSMAHINGAVLHWVKTDHEQGLKLRHFNNTTY
jgi:Fe-S cluster assembly iron-binding protein IscA